MKTSELTGAQLDYWVGRAYDCPVEVRDGRCVWLPNGGFYNPHENWVTGGSIIELEGLSLLRWESPNDDGTFWTARNLTATISQPGLTPLIAAMRCFVASKFGEEVPDSTG